MAGLTRVLAVNAGSSSVKLRLLGPDDAVLASRDLPATAGRFDHAELAGALGQLAAPGDVVAHRVVHGGSRFVAPVLVDGDVRQALAELADLAPLHQAPSLAAMQAAMQALPAGTPEVACFDTAFHATLPAAATTYAVPQAWRSQGVRRYGFHGLSHAHVARRTAELAGADPRRQRVVSCHLGSGASLAAIVGSRSVDTTMGFTPLDGLVMATRSGSLDPGMLPWLVDHGVPLDEQSRALEHSSGLVALAGTPDMEAVLQGAADDAGCRLALDVYLHRLRGAVAAMAAAMGGLDVLAFTGGVGEHAAPVRSACAAGLGFLGVGVDEAANVGAVPDADISAAGAPVRTVVLEAREDLEMASQARQLVVSDRPPSP